MPERKNLLWGNLSERDFFFLAVPLGFANYRRYRLIRFCSEDGSELFYPFFPSTNRLASLRDSAKSRKMTIGEAPYERILSLPIFPGIDDDNVDDVIETLWKVITAYAIETPAAAFATAC
jgi:dTDP-4-amino-4,6-dideoxygalactose transaminase